MLRLLFHPGARGEPALARAPYFRLCSDGTLRGSDNSIVARREGNGWRLGQRLFCDWECTGPVKLRVRAARVADSALLGPFTALRVVDGRLYSQEQLLPITVPGAHEDEGYASHEIAMLPAEATVAVTG